tara:strand:- start:2754 stop:2915 length:162 start_codon:yes stop_codon:yes gene_type:complete
MAEKNKFVLRKVIRKIGDSLGLIFNREERTAYKFKKDDVMEISISRIIGGKKK